MRFGLDVGTSGPFADPRVLADLAVEAESAGWDGFFLWDILFSGPLAEPQLPVADPWIALAAIAMATQRMRIGAMVTPLPRRRPWQVAREAVTLDHLSDGRLTFGAGIGWQTDEFTAVGEDPDPRARAAALDEGLAIIDALWQGEPIRSTGKHYRLEGARLLPRPVQQPRIPVWLATGWPNRRPLERAVRWDGVYLMTWHQVEERLLTPDDVREVALVVSQSRSSAAPFDIAVNTEVPDGADPVATVGAFQAAGATWWMERCPDTPAEYLERIRRGPPGR